MVSSINIILNEPRDLTSDPMHIHCMRKLVYLKFYYLTCAKQRCTQCRWVLFETFPCTAHLPIPMEKRGKFFWPKIYYSFQFFIPARERWGHEAVKKVTPLSTEVRKGTRVSPPKWNRAFWYNFNGTDRMIDGVKFATRDWQSQTRTLIAGGDLSS